MKRLRNASPSPDTIVKGGPYSSSSRSNVSGSKSDGGESAAELPADDASLRDLSPPVTVSPTCGVPSPPAIVGNALTINGRTYITTEQFALMLDVSLRSASSLVCRPQRTAENQDNRCLL